MKRVLIVDDEADIREIIREELAMIPGYQAEEAQSGNEALEILRRGGIDAVISDISMPNGSGMDLLKGARALSADKPAIILISGFSDGSQVTAYDIGVDGILPKPFDLVEIGNCLNRVLLPRKLRWAGPSNSLPKALPLQRQVQGSIALSGNPSFGLGRGGFWVVADKNSIPIGAAVRFEISFSEGPLPKLEGTGWIRWTRRDKFPAFGIEIHSLEPASLATVLDLTRDEIKPGLPYIPSGITPSG